jgi:hypothetical protein
MPLSPTNMVVWLDADKYSSVTVNGSNQLTAWTDSSGNSTPVNINSYATRTSINSISRYYLNFVSSDVQITFPTTYTIKNITFYTVFSGNSALLTGNVGARLLSFRLNSNNDTNGTTGFSINSNQPGYDLNLGYGASNLGRILTLQSSTSGSEIIGTYNSFSCDNSLYILTVNIQNIGVNQNQVYIYINGYLASTYQLQNDHSFNIINLGNYNSNYWKGYINEFIFYNSSLDTNTHANIINYLSTKWSIATGPNFINQYVPRTFNSSATYLNLKTMLTNNTNAITVSDTVDKSGAINLPIPYYVTNVLANQITVGSQYNISSLDFSKIFYAKSIVTNAIINLPFSTF